MNRRVQVRLLVKPRVERVTMCIEVDVQANARDHSSSCRSRAETRTRPPSWPSGREGMRRVGAWRRGVQAGRCPASNHCSFFPPPRRPAHNARTPWRRPLVRGAAIAALALVASCYHWAEVATMWGAPGKRAMQFDNVVAVFASSDDSLRRLMENRLVAQFPRGTPSYRLLASTGTDDRRRGPPRARRPAIRFGHHFDRRACEPTSALIAAADPPRSPHPFPARRSPNNGTASGILRSIRLSYRTSGWSRSRCRSTR